MTAAEDSDVTATLVGFARTLRAAGVDASPERVQAMVTATSHLLGGPVHAVRQPRRHRAL